MTDNIFKVSFNIIEEVLGNKLRKFILLNQKLDNMHPSQSPLASAEFYSLLNYIQQYDKSLLCLGFQYTTQKV